MDRRCTTVAMSWKDLHDIISSEKLEELGRSAAQHAQYLEAMDTIKQQYSSIGDYIKITKRVSQVLFPGFLVPVCLVSDPLVLLKTTSLPLLNGAPSGLSQWW